MKLSTEAVLFTFFSSFALAHLKVHHDVIYDDTLAMKSGGLRVSGSGRTHLKVVQGMVSIKIHLCVLHVLMFECSLWLVAFICLLCLCT